MSRQSSTTITYPWRVENRNRNSPDAFKYFDSGNMTVYTRDITRSDVRRNKATFDGFRYPSPYEMDISERTTMDGLWVEDRPKESALITRYSGDMSRFINPTRPVVDLPGLNMQSRCETKCLLKVKDQKVHIGATLAEAREAATMLANSAVKLYNAFKAVKRGDLKKAAGILGVPAPRKRGKDVSSNWLELQYGWLPLLSDVYGVYEEIRHLTSDRPIRFTSTASVKEDLPTSYPVDVSGFGFGRYFSPSCKVVGYRAVKVSLTYQVDSRLLNDISRNGLLNPVEVAWEVVPFSFLVDWFLPVGDWLSALTADAGLQFVAGSKTLFTSYSAVTLLVGNGKEVVGTISGSRNVKSMRRTVYSSTPVPTPYVKSPFSIGHGLNALALLRSLL